MKTLFYSCGILLLLLVTQVNGYHEDFHSTVRSKRLLTTDETDLWPKGIVPYKIDDDVVVNKAKYLQVIALYEEQTCIRFVPKPSALYDQLQFGYSGFVRFYKGSGCHAALPSKQLRSSKKGSRVSCCFEDTCLHEIGHSLGFRHEQGNVKIDGWIRVNRMEIWPGSDSPNYDMRLEDKYIDAPWPFDISSIMLYRPWMFRVSDKPTMIMEYAEQEFKHYSYFYFFRELVNGYKCSEKEVCTRQNVKCFNEGYISVVRGKCQCRCPEGLDPATGCSTVWKRVNESWPRGRYSLIKPKSGCPNGFKEGSFKMQNINVRNTNTHMAEEFHGKQTNWHFCTRTTRDDVFNDEYEKKFNWPIGNYCVFRKGQKCPAEFYTASTGFGAGVSLTDFKGEIPDVVNTSDGISLQLCCQMRGMPHYETTLSTERPFMLIKYDTRKCQKIQGAHVQPDSLIEFIDPNNTVTFKGIDLQINGKNRLHICHYVPADMDCGGVIELSSNNRTVTIEGRGGRGRSDLDCTWIIKGDKKEGTLLLEVEEFKPDPSSPHSSCKNKLQISNSYIGHYGIDYCGPTIDHSIRSISDKIRVRFVTQKNSAFSFKAKIKWIPNEDLCYDVKDKGVSYAGKVNYTRTFEPCLPWSQVTSCPHHTFNNHDKRQALEGNYCRNPDNSHHPWCYTDIKGCKRNYCEVCGIEPGFDRMKGCKNLKEIGYCTKDGSLAVRNCASTCFNDFAPDWKSLPKYSEIKCSPPTPPFDGDLEGEHRNQYTAGEEVKFRCKHRKDQVTTTCLTNGQWSPAFTACPECGGSDLYHSEHCYKLVNSTYMHLEQAIKECRKYPGGYLAAPKSMDETKIIRNAAGPREKIWIGVFRRKSYGPWTYDDNRNLTWARWSLDSRSHPSFPTRCSVMTAKNDWMASYCANPQFHAVCAFPLKEIQCQDALGDHCTSLISNRPTMCKEFPNFAKINCRLSCGFCHQKCSIPQSALYVNPSMTGAISVGENVRFSCKKFTYRHSGDEIRGCLPNGNLSGEPLQCDVCPVGYIKYNDNCHGLVASTRQFEAFEVCAENGGKVAQPRTYKELDFISKKIVGKLEFFVDVTFITPLEKGIIKYVDSLNVLHMVADHETRKLVCTIPIDDKYICYNPRNYGLHYNGKVNRTINNVPCMSWAESTRCKFNPFTPGLKVNNLEQNYCRNPDGSKTGPWCYTKHCLKRSCNVCGEGNESDTASDCESFRKRGLCSVNVDDAMKKCAYTCRDLLPDSGPGNYKKLACEPPTPPNDAEIAGKIKPNYYQGDVVGLKCKKNKFIVNTTCLSDGRWSEVGSACLECPPGYSLHGNTTCYKLCDTDRLKFREAEDECAKDGAHLPQPNSAAEDNLLGKLTLKLSNGKKTNIWLRANSSSATNLHWADNTKAMYTNWDTSDRKKPFPRGGESCVFKRGNNKWENVDCEFPLPHMGLVCISSKQAADVVTCEDYLNLQCPTLLVAKPKMCSEFPEFAHKFCRRTCEICEYCSLQNIQNTISSQESVIKVGRTVHYSCEEGYIAYKGDSIRTCKPNGELTGSDLVCLSVFDRRFGQIGNINVKYSDYRDGLPANYSFIGNGEREHDRIKRKGKIIAWEFFSKASTSIHFQVWKYSGDGKTVKFTFHGENVVQATQNKVMTYVVPEAERIEIREGYAIGFMQSNKNGIQFVNCEDLHNNPKLFGLYQSKQDHFAQGYTRLQQYQFFFDLKCTEMSFLAVVEYV